MLDPAIDAEARIKRTFAVRFDGMEQDLKFARVMSQPLQDHDDIKKQIADVERDAVALGYPKLRDKKNRRIGIGVRMPAATEIVREVLDEEGAYRIFSAVSHGQAGTIRQLSYSRVPGSGSTMQMGGGPATPFKKTVNPERMAWLGLIAAKAFAQPAWYEFTYADWNKEPLKGLFEATFDRLGARPSVRFWRCPPAGIIGHQRSHQVLRPTRSSVHHRHDELDFSSTQGISLEGCHVPYGILQRCRYSCPHRLLVAIFCCCPTHDLIHQRTFVRSHASDAIRAAIHAYTAALEIHQPTFNRDGD